MYVIVNFIISFIRNCIVFLVGGFLFIISFCFYIESKYFLLLLVGYKYTLLLAGGYFTGL